VKIALLGTGFGQAHTAVYAELAYLTGQARNLIEPASALPALRLTLDVHQRLTRAAS
jgi:hypothetical protein